MGSSDLTVDARVGTLRGSIRTSPEPGIEEGLGFTPRSPLALEANLELAEMRPLLAAFQTQGRVAGRAVARLRGSGTLGKPQLEGTLEATGLGYELPPWGLSVRDGRLRARLLGDNMEITELFLRAGEGTFTARGTLPLRFAAQKRSSSRWALRRSPMAAPTSRSSLLPAVPSVRTPTGPASSS